MPGVHGRDLTAYVAAGIRSDHEASAADEGRERLRAGMWLLVSAILISFAATLFPSWQAAKLDPAAALRYE